MRAAQQRHGPVVQALDQFAASKWPGGTRSSAQRVTLRVQTHYSEPARDGSRGIRADAKNKRGRRDVNAASNSREKGTAYEL